MKFRSRFQAVMWIAVLLSLACFLLFQWGCSMAADGLFPALRVTALTCFYHLAVRLLIGEWLVPALGMRGVNCEGAWFRQHPWEAKLYRRLRVQNWKGRLPTYDPSEFDLRRLGPEALLRATCQAEIVHELNAAASFVPLGFSRWFGALPVFAITSLAAACFDLTFVILQRYNRPRLLRLIQMQRARRPQASPSRPE